ncbi:MAG: ferrous iron transport protein A [Clostridiales bacterium]|nr:ferrous iron transport protein A [Clostridiales bacterium]
MQKTLDQFVIGEHGVVRAVTGEGKIKRRLFDMGITPGAEIMLRKKAPLGDPLEITVRGYELTLRITEAQCVTMLTPENETESTAGVAK